MIVRAVVRGNCIVWAIRRRFELERAYRAAGRPAGYSPAIRIRGSYLEPRQILGVKVSHWEVEHWTGAHWVREGWAPLDSRPLRGIGLLRALWTDGEIVREVLSASDPGPASLPA